MKTKNLRNIFAVSSLMISLIILSSTSIYSQEVKIRIVKRDAVLRLDANDESEVIRGLPMGSEYVVEETVGVWVKIKMPPDKDGIVITGYVHKSYLDFEIDSSLDYKKVEPEKEKIEVFPKEEIDLKEVEYMAWKHKLSIVKAKEKTGKIIGSMSGITFGIGISSILFKDDYIAFPVLLTSFGLVGVIISTLIELPAKAEVKRLEEEGKIKGYIQASINPLPQGFCIQLRYSF